MYACSDMYPMPGIPLGLCLALLEYWVVVFESLVKRMNDFWSCKDGVFEELGIILRININCVERCDFSVGVGSRRVVWCCIV